MAFPLYSLTAGVRVSLLMQTLGTYQSDHVAPLAGVLKLLNSSSYQNVLGSNPYYAPESFQYTLPDIFFQLDALGPPLHSFCKPHDVMLMADALLMSMTGTPFLLQNFQLAETSASTLGFY